MSKVFVSMVMSLDGFVGPLVKEDDVNYEYWMKQWGKLQSWVFPQKFFRESLKLGEGGETGPDNQILEEIHKRTGVSIMGKHMFDGGEHRWPEEAPFHSPVFVVTNQVREPWVRPGGTTFYFVNDGIESALAQARAVAGDRDIRISGGGNLAGQYIAAGLVDELHIAIAPLFLGEGIPLFQEIDGDKINLEIAEVVNSPCITHIYYKVKSV